MSVFIIAEAGANHDRDLNQAKNLVDIAVQSGCDAVKFQTYSSETLYADNVEDFAGYKNINKLIKNLELPREWQKELFQYCNDSGIEFMSTPFDEEAIEELCNLGVKRLKIAGFESTDPRFVKLVASTGLPIIFTAGIGSGIDQISETISWILEENKSPDITVLHGNNAYPTPLSDSNLGEIRKILDLQELGTFFPHDFTVGISDHTEGVLVPPLAVVSGAEVVEKHFTISRSLSGPDHKFAIEPKELKQMVKNIRSSEQCLGYRKNRYTISEQRFKKATRSVVATRDIYPGECLTNLNTTTMRPFLDSAIPAKKYYDTLYKVAKNKISKNHVVFEGDVRS